MEKYRKWTDEATGINPFIKAKTAPKSAVYLLISLVPLSIIIVGMGEAKFEGMNRLDGDIGIFNKNRISCPRDIVQFVPFRDVRMDGDRLAKRLLAELPTQI